ncbi:PREDICTED: uncharacterized protein K02A2.6-like [Wasmannia auropunctata]|uniref:uncharacterized protein K02A2.6-like n=1 Tax=Wasmannia auropunctata TaxID=64793 RepID=UPI0005EF8749|nr:PREDICTED: uncharacterized protein K02A2.6-like [Wasmannia auropunctata]
MKRRIRAKVWWPLVDREVEKFVKQCRDCLLVSQSTRPVPMKRHKFPNEPWQCLATDLVGPLPNHNFVLVVIDYYSRYVEVAFLRKITSETIINSLEAMFARLGIPKSLRADNGRQFVNEEFRKFCQRNDKLITSPLYWPQANVFTSTQRNASRNNGDNTIGTHMRPNDQRQHPYLKTYQKIKSSRELETWTA